MKALVLGSGKIGTVIAKDLSNSLDKVKFTIADINEDQAKAAASQVEDAEWVLIDTTDKIKLKNLLSNYDIVLGALPGNFGYSAMEAAIEAETDMIDVSYTPTVPTDLDKAAKKAEITIIPDCGVAPGLSNILVGYSTTKLDLVDEVKIMVGGIPNEPIPPLEYTVTWSVEGLIDEYVRPVKIIQQGSIVEVPPLTGLEEIKLPGLAKLEAFYTDGLRTLTQTFPGVKEMWEKTLRYPGHTAKINLLKELGFFSEIPVNVKGALISPRDLTSRLLEKSLWKPEVEDLLVMRIQVDGKINGIKSSIVHQLVDRYDYEKKVSAMGRTTAYTASTVAGTLLEGLIDEKGVVPPERLGMDEHISSRIFEVLKRKGINIETQKK